MDRDDLQGMRMARREGELSTRKAEAQIARGLEYGLPAAPSIKDRSISLFSRGELPHFAGINTFLKVPYLEDVRTVGASRCGDRGRAAGHGHHVPRGHPLWPPGHAAHLRAVHDLQL